MALTGLRKLSQAEKSGRKWREIATYKITPCHGLRTSDAFLQNSFCFGCLFRLSFLEGFCKHAFCFGRFPFCFRCALYKEGPFSRGRFASAISKEFFLGRILQNPWTHKAHSTRPETRPMGRILSNGPYNSPRGIIELLIKLAPQKHTRGSVGAAKQVLLQNGPQKNSP